MNDPAGQNPAGYFGAGFGPSPTAAQANRVAPAVGLFLDLSVMDFPVDANGQYVEIHNVDHLALMLIGPENELWTGLEITNEADMTRRADEIVRAKWKRLLDAGDIGEVAVSAKPSAGGRADIRIRYRNLRDKTDPQDPYQTIEIH